jgi:catechol 2,3-dioxygenase-like lactoylglutathione lyase family enzyme
MLQHLIHIAIVVSDYDEAIEYYTNILGFQLLEDTKLSDTKRWVLVAPSASAQTAILLAKADGETQQTAIGNQSGGRVFLFLGTDNFWEDYNLLLSKGVIFVRQPIEESYGTVAVFKDLYGNIWDLIERKV